MSRTSRLLHAAAFLSLAAVIVALISQHLFDMRPCAWCVIQRLVLLVIALVCWGGVWAERRGHVALPRVAAALAAALGALGIVAAWYQHSVAAKMFSCDQTFADKFMVASGLDAHIPWLFGIFATCMDARVELLGVEYALWALALFALVSLLAVAALAGRPHRGGTQRH